MVRCCCSRLSFRLAPACCSGLFRPGACHASTCTSTLKDAGRGSAGGGSVWAGGGNLRRLLVMTEVALSVVLLIGAGLLIRSFARLQDVPPGFNPSRVLTLELTMTGRRYNDAEAVLEAYRQLWERLRVLPGVTASGGVSSLPLSQMFAWGPITVEGRTTGRGGVHQRRYTSRRRRVLPRHGNSAVTGRLFAD